MLPPMSIKPSRTLLLIFFMLGAVSIEGMGIVLQEHSLAKKEESAGWELYKKGMIYRLLGQRSQAQGAFKAAVEADPDFVPAHREYIRVAFPVMVKAEYEEKLSKAPRRLALHLAVGTIYAYLGPLSAAEAEFQKAAEIDPDSPWVHWHWGMLFYQSGALDEARAAYQRASELGNDLAEIHSALADAFLRMNEFPRAIAESQRALEIRPDGLWVYPVKWLAQINRGPMAESLRAAISKEIQSVLQPYKARPEALAVARQGYDLLDEREPAQHLAADMKRLQPDWDENGDYMFPGWDKAGNRFVIRGTPARQMLETYNQPPSQYIKVLQTAAAEIRDERVKAVVIYPELARAYARAGEWEKAEPLMAHAPEWDRKVQIRVAQTLAFAYADQKVQRPKARRMAERLLRESEALEVPSNTRGLPEEIWQFVASSERQQIKELQDRSYDLLGWVLFQSGARRAAAKRLARSLQGQRTESNLFHMAMLKKAQGQRREALALFIEAYGYEGPLKEQAEKEAQALARQPSRPVMVEQ